MSKRKKFWLVVSLAVAVVVLIPLSLRWQAQGKLNAYRKKLMAAGEKLTVEELAPKSDPRATNTALFLKLASKIKPMDDYSPSGMLSIKPGVARVAWRQPKCMEEGLPKMPLVDVWPLLTDGMRTNQQTLGELQAVLDTGGIEFIQNDSQPGMNAGYLTAAREAARSFKFSAILALHQGRMQEACGYLTSCRAASQLLEKERTFIGQLVLYGCLSSAIGGYWEALQADGWTDEQLAQMQHQWDQADIMASAALSLSMERGLGANFFQKARHSRQELGSLMNMDFNIWNDLMVSPRQGMDELLTAYPRTWGWQWIGSYSDEQRYLAAMQSRIEALRDAQQGPRTLSSPKHIEGATPLLPPNGAKIDLASVLTGLNDKFMAQALLAQTTANMVTAAIALARFRLAHHAYPGSLAKLAPEFVPAVPVDCMDGHALRYRLNPDGAYLLYAIGLDGIDHGGDATPEEGWKPSFSKGRDLVWPRPATAEEVQAYETEQGKPKKNK